MVEEKLPFNLLNFFNLFNFLQNRPKKLNPLTVDIQIPSADVQISTVDI